MEEIIMTSRQQMLSPEQLAYELGLIPTPKKIENTKIATYVIIGAIATIAIGIISYALYQNHIKQNKNTRLN